VAVDGLPEIIETQKVDTDAVARGEMDVEICLDVEKQADAVAAGAADIKKIKAGNESIEALLDLSLYQTISNYAVTGGEKTLVSMEKKDIGRENTNVLEIAIPHVSGRTPIMYRYHDGEAEKLTALNARPVGNYEDGTYFIDNGYILLYAKSFSTYAIGYTQSYGGGGEATRITSAPTGDAGVVLYVGMVVMSLLGTGVVVGTRKRKKF